MKTIGIFILLKIVEILKFITWPVRKFFSKEHLDYWKDLWKNLFKNTDEIEDLWHNVSGSILLDLCYVLLVIEGIVWFYVIWFFLIFIISPNFFILMSSKEKIPLLILSPFLILLILFAIIAILSPGLEWISYNWTQAKKIAKGESELKDVI